MNKIIETSIGRFSISVPLRTTGLFGSGMVSWNSAVEAAARLGEGWRLPTLQECESIHLETDAFDSIEGDWVLWCMEEYEENPDCAYIYDSAGVMTGHWNKDEEFNAVAVRTE